MVNVDAGANRVSVIFDQALYPLDAIYGAAYIFIDRCFVLLDSEGEGRVRVELKGRKSIDEAALGALAGEFSNELLTQAWRQKIAEANQPIIEAVVAQALAGAAGPQDLASLDSMDFSEESFEDPLGIAMSWEEKYGQEPAGPAVEGQPKGAPPAQAAEEPAGASGESDD